ncbi:hypothetical protein Tco_1225425 [Tanacetum coccineum]
MGNGTLNLGYIDNEVCGKSIQHGEIKEASHKVKDGVYRLMAVPKDHPGVFMAYGSDCQEIWAVSRQGLVGNAELEEIAKSVLKLQLKAFTSSSKGNCLDERMKMQIKVFEVPFSCTGTVDIHNDISSSPWHLIIVLFYLKPKPLQAAQASQSSDYLDQIVMIWYLEEMDINCMIAMDAIKIKKFYKKTGARQEWAGRKERKQRSIKGVEQTTDEELNHGSNGFTVNNEIENLEKYRRIGMKAVKDKDALQQIFDSWSASSKNLWKLIDCGMSSTVKIGLGYGIKSNAEVLGYEEEISRGIFAFRETNAGYNDIPLYSRFKQVEYKGVPHPLSGDYTPREQEDIDDSLDGEQGTVSDHSVNDDPIPIPSSEQVSTSIQKTQPQANLILNVDPTLCTAFVKTPRPTKIRVNVNTGHGNVSSGRVYVNTGTQFKSGGSRFNTGHGNVSSGRVVLCMSNTAETYKSNIYAVKGKMGTAVKTSAGCVWRKAIPLSNINSGPTPDSNVNDHPLKHMEHRGIFDSGCSGHMTGNRAHLEDYQELSKVGSVTFGGSKGSISGKGKIRLGNLVAK